MKSSILFEIYKVIVKSNGRFLQCILAFLNNLNIKKSYTKCGKGGFFQKVMAKFSNLSK
jgi:hypothetical protein